MDASTTNRSRLILPIASIATFWMLPFSPFISMAAVYKTRTSTGWPRKLAVIGAMLCAVYTIALATLLVVLCLSLPTIAQ
ncbi:MAG: hypothetical protein JWP89_5003 [Schlesneria sp.]|nr:hypothetical protein [Schlesneria sp.]